MPKEKLGAIILVLDELARPEDLAKPVLTAATSLRDLAPNARVITVSRTGRQSSRRDPATAAARQGVDGLLRSLAKELRAGATGQRHPARRRRRHHQPRDARGAAVLPLRPLARSSTGSS